jgi:hypothetical protein
MANQVLSLTSDVFLYLNLALACIAIRWMLLVGFYVPWRTRMSPTAFHGHHQIRLSAVPRILLAGLKLMTMLMREALAPASVICREPEPGERASSAQYLVLMAFLARVQRYGYQKHPRGDCQH